MTAGTRYRQPWLQSFPFDFLFILFPSFLALIATIFLPAEYKNTDKTSVAGWVILILLVDVAHVYSTLFRTYWDKERFEKHRALYLAIPVGCYVAGVLLYTFDGLVFWRVLAYLAVYHFIRQQYGFMRLYARFESKDHWRSKVDTVAIYTATLYPLVYWHCTPGRNFNWFVNGDFLIHDLAMVREAAWYFYLLVIAVYLIKELRELVQHKRVNAPKNMVIAGTFLSWYFGIVYFNGDLVFTLLNVVAHGIPYMSLIWLYQQKEKGRPLTSFVSLRFPKYTIAFFLLSICIFGYLEEGLWDGLVWKEHAQVFSAFQSLPVLHSKELLALVVPLLSLPQATHYVLDGFIWKRPKPTDS